MTGGDEHGGAEMKLWAHEARARSAAHIVQAVRAAGSAAAIRERVECMIDRVAERNPQYAGPLQAISGTAVRRRAGIAACHGDSGAAGRPGGQLLPGLRDEPEASVVSALEAYLRDMAIAQQRDRMASEVQDKVIQRVFAAGLTLQRAAGLTMQPGMRRRVEAVADELDEVIRVIRDAVFNLPGPAAGHEPGGMTGPS